MAQLAIHLFGSPRVEVDSQQIEISRRKAVALLAYLGVTGQPHSREALAALLWPESSQRRAGASLRSALWALNKTPLEDWLRVDAETAALPSADTMTINVVRFRELLAAPQAHDHSAAALCTDCVDAVTAAVDLYQDDFMAGFTLPDAVELYAAARQSPYIANSVWFGTIAGEEIAQAAARLLPDVAAALFLQQDSATLHK